MNFTRLVLELYCSATDSIDKHYLYSYRINAYPVSVEEKTAQEQVLKVFPNPVGEGALHVSSDVKLTGLLQIFNSVGRLISEQKLNMSNGENLQVNTMSWGHGLYMLRFESGNRVEILRVVK